jgi:streptogramin lyase
MAEKGRVVATIIITIFIIYMLVGMFGLLPAEYDLVKKVSTGVNYSDIHEIIIPQPTYPAEIQVDGGNVYFISADGSTPETLFKYSKSTGTFTQIDFPENTLTYSTNMVIDGTGGKIYTPVWDVPSIDNEYIAIYDQQTANWVESIDVFPYHSAIMSIAIDGVFDDGGKMWVSCPRTEKLAYFTEATRDNPVFYDVPQDGGNDFQAFDIGVDDTGNVWMADRNHNRLSMFDSVTTQFSFYYYTDNIASATRNIAIDGNTVWFTHSVDNGAIGKLDMDTGDITLYGEDMNIYPFDLAVDKLTHDVWATDLNGRILKMTEDGTFTQFSTGGTSNPYGIVVDEDSGTVWFTLNGINKLGSIQINPDVATVKITKINDWTSESTNEPSVYVNTPIEITAEITSPDGVSQASLYYTGTNTTALHTLDFNITEGDGTSGTWTVTIPAQANIGNITAYTYVITSLNNKTTTPEFTIHVVDKSQNINGSGGIGMRQYIYGGGIVVLFGVAVVINRKKK